VTKNTTPPTRKPPARQRSGVRERKHGLTIVSVLFLLVLLIWPLFALVQLSRRVGQPLLLSYPLVVSAVTYYVYARDKKLAQTGGWRTKEMSLHLCELLGGWPGAFLAQRTLRHKNAKVSYQFAFWFIVLAHELASYDYLKGGRLSKGAMSLISSALK
jgi:uncharacterized membrane protein YsdA (DUF1294 family)